MDDSKQRWYTRAETILVMDSLRRSARSHCISRTEEVAVLLLNGSSTPVVMFIKATPDQVDIDPDLAEMWQRGY